MVETLAARCSARSVRSTSREPPLVTKTSVVLGEPSTVDSREEKIDKTRASLPRGRTISGEELSRQPAASYLLLMPIRHRYTRQPSTRRRFSNFRRGNNVYAPRQLLVNTLPRLFSLPDVRTFATF